MKLRSRLIASILCFLFLPQLQAQPYKEHPPVFEDFNKDGVVDTLYSVYESGSTFGGTNLKIINGKTSQVLTFSTDRCYCSIQKVFLIPPVLQKPENKFFLKKVQKELFPSIRDQPDASLQWIINGYFSNKEIAENKYFDLIVYPDISWSTKEIEVPDNYSLLIKGDTLKRLYSDKESDVYKEYNFKSNYGFLKYCGSCILYGTPLPKLTSKNEVYQIYSTSHGIYAEKGALKKWIFISDLGLTGSPDKLRWQSIGKTVLIGKYLVFQHMVPPDTEDNLYVINIETGVVVKLKYRFESTNYKRNADGFLGDRITYIEEYKNENPIFIEYEDLFKELEALYEKLKLQMD